MPAARRAAPRWLTVRRGEPGRRVGITLLAIAIVLTLFAGRLVQIQGMESGYYKAAANAEKLTTSGRCPRCAAPSTARTARSWR